RFRRYIATLSGGTDDLVLPIVGMNPMGKEHCAVALDHLIALEAERVAERAIAEVRSERPDLEDAIQVCLCLCDDLHGAWTNRGATEASYRYRDGYGLRRGFAVVPCWTSETWSADDVRRETRMAIARYAWMKRHGTPRTLAEILRQEGQAMIFGGV